MADWKTQVSYNYSPSYHTYAYGFMYQPGPDQNPNLTGWGENGAPDMTNYDAGATQTYYTNNTAGTREESPPQSPEPHPVNGHCYQGSGVVYLGNHPTSRLLLTGPHGNAVASRAGSDSASDSEAHTSPGTYRTPFLVSLLNYVLCCVMTYISS